MAAELAQIYTPVKPKKRRGKPTPIRTEETPQAITPMNQPLTQNPMEVDYVARANAIVADMDTYHNNGSVRTYRAKRQQEERRDQQALAASQKRARRLAGITIAPLPSEGA